MYFSERIANSRPATNPVPAEVDFRCEEWGRILSDAAVKKDFGLSTIAQAYMAKAKLAQPINAAEEKADIAINTPTSPKATEKPLQKITAGDVNAWLRGSNIPNLPTRKILYSILGANEAQMKKYEDLMKRADLGKDYQPEVKKTVAFTTLYLLEELKDLIEKHHLPMTKQVKISISNNNNPGSSGQLISWEVFNTYITPMKEANPDDYKAAEKKYIEILHRNVSAPNELDIKKIAFLPPKYLSDSLLRCNNSSKDGHAIDADTPVIPIKTRAEYCHIAYALLKYRLDETNSSKKWLHSSPSKYSKYNDIRSYIKNNQSSNLMGEFDEQVYLSLPEARAQSHTKSFAR